MAAPVWMGAAPVAVTPVVGLAAPVPVGAAEPADLAPPAEKLMGWPGTTGTAVAEFLAVGAGADSGQPGQTATRVLETAATVVIGAAGVPAELGPGTTGTTLWDSVGGRATEV